MCLCLLVFVYLSTCVCMFVHVYVLNVSAFSDSECVCVCWFLSTYLRVSVRAHFALQGGEDLFDALSCRSFSAKEPLITGLFCGA